MLNGIGVENAINTIRVRIFYGGKIVVTPWQPSDSFESFHRLVRSIFQFDSKNPFTIKWIDDDGDPCTISSNIELREMIRLYELNHDGEIIFHVFPSIPIKAGDPCAGEDRSIYRRGARRWRKIYYINGHHYQARRFSKSARCAVCSDRIWGLGRQGFRCIQCRLLVHKRCHKQIRFSCTGSSLDFNEFTLRSTSNVALNSNKLPLNSVFKSTDDVSVQLETEKSAHSEGISLADFNLLRVIGRGSYAKVFLAEERRTQRHYAMKVIKKSLVSEDEDLDWVQTEKHVFEQASNHPFLVGLHSCFQTNERLFFVIEFVNGGDLMFHMQRQRKLPEDHARFYAAEISVALHYLHCKGILYRDLKLDNVLLDSDGHIKLTDYGMCKEGLAIGERTGTFCGTPNYIAPEMLRGEEYGPSVDWWALGVLLFEMMAGRSPFEILQGAADNVDLNTEDQLFQAILDKPIRIPRHLSDRATSALKGFLQKNPKERLGCQYDDPNIAFSDIMSHSFFRPIDFRMLLERQITPPYKPNVSGDTDLTHFDKQFVDEPVILTVEDSNLIAQINQSEFEGFEYINPLLIALEDTV